MGLQYYLLSVKYNLKRLKWYAWPLIILGAPLAIILSPFILMIWGVGCIFAIFSDV